MATEQPPEQQAQGLGIAQASQGGTAIVNINSQPAISRDPHRQRLLTKVRVYWVTGVLEQSLHGAALLELGLQEEFDVEINPWQLTVQECSHLPHQLSPGKPIIQVYDEAGGEMLLLGDPGSGKTTLLLQLARDLLDRAQQDENQLIPVVFNLSSWAVRCQPLADWLVEELHSKYEVSLSLGREWVARDQILPLLDGLDEVMLERRAACIEAINDYKQEHGQVPMVVCCRHADYDAVVPQARLAHLCALTIQPLTLQQINDYLAKLGETLGAMRKALQADPDLQEIATTPLMLSVLTLAYSGRSINDLVKEHSSLSRKQQIFTTYVDRMLHRRGASTLYTPEQTIQWLSWLARHMKQSSQTIFHLERMQPSWLASTGEGLTYTILVRGSIGILIGGIGWGSYMLYSVLYHFLLGLFDLGLSSLEWAKGLAGAQSQFTSKEMSNALLFGAFCGIIYGLMSRVESAIEPAEIITWSWKNIKQHLKENKTWSVWVIFGTLGAVLGAAIGTRDNILFGPGRIQIPMALGGLLFGFFGGLLFSMVHALMSTLPDSVRKRPSEDAYFQESQYNLPQRLSVGLISGLIIGLIFGAVAGVFSWVIAGLDALTNQRVYWLRDVLLLGLRYGIISGILIGGLGGLIMSVMCLEKGALRPVSTLLWVGKNAWQCLRNSDVLAKVLIIGCFFGFLSGLETLGEGWQIFELLWLGVIDGLLGGVVFGILTVLVSGLSSKTMEEQALVHPNQGIRRSTRNSILVGIVFGMLAWLFLGLTQAFAYVNSGWTNAVSLLLSYGLAAGLLCAPLIGLPNGGIACLQHGVLRFLLWREGSIPHYYIPFLDYAAERVLLRKVGGGYIFVHRLLLEHFATLPSAYPSLIEAPLPRTHEQCVRVYGNDQQEEGKGFARDELRGQRSKKPVPNLQAVFRSPQVFRRQGRAFPISLVDFLSIGLIIGTLLLSCQIWENTHSFYPLPHWKMILNESLARNHGRIWDENIERGSACVFTQGAYHIRAWRPQLKYCLARKLNVRNFALEAQIALTRDSDCFTVGAKHRCGGLIFRFDAKSQSFYGLRIENKKDSPTLPHYILNLYQHGHYVRRIAQSPNIFLPHNSQQPTLVAVVAQGYTFDIYVQHMHLATLQDSEDSLSQGQIGLMVDAEDLPAEIVAHHLNVWVPGP